jgi:DNA-binding response OmpR family regulator
MRERKTVLVVEDDPYLSAVLEDALGAEGYEVLHATNGFSGLLLAEQHRPRVIILDLMLPEVSGLEMLSEVRQHGTVADTPVLMITASADRVPRAAAAGLDRLLQKPFDLGELLDHVRALSAGS